jgi:LPS-assembly protein
VTSREYPVALLEYRYLFPWGKTSIETSFGAVDRRENNNVIGTNPRGHIKWTGDANIDENWRAKAQLYRSSDDTYLRRFKIDSSGVLRSFATLEGFYEGTYVNATTFSAQDLRVDTLKEDTPDALPYIAAEYRSALGRSGLDLTAAGGLRTLFRTNGADSQHLAAEVGIGREWFFGGHVIDAKASVRGDVFAAQGLAGQTNDTGYSGRLLPRATVGWAYPLFKPIGESSVLTLTPRAMVTATASSLDSGNLPNEDSQSVEFDSTVLFRPTFAAGWDRFDDGQRLDFGIEGKLDTRTARLSGLIGQSYRIDSTRAFGAGTGLDRPFSDVVIGAGAQIDKWLDGAARVRWDTANGSLSAAESRVRIGYDPIQLSLTHTMLGDRTTDGSTLNGIHQLDGTVRARLSDYWVGFVRHQRDFEENRPLRSQIGFSYADECLRFETVFTRESFQNPEVKDDNSIIFRIALRNFGQGSNNHKGFFRE